MDFAFYCQRGWYLLPIHRETKIPCIKAGEGFVNASNDPDQLIKWAVKFPGCNWGLALKRSGLVAVDVDRGGLENWRQLVSENGEPKTLKARSGSGVGLHYVFKNSVEERYAAKLAPGIDVKHNGFIVVEPSLHHTGGMYEWVNDLNPVKMPGWISSRVLKPERPPVRIEDIAKMEPGRLADIAATLKDQPLDYSDWIACGQAFHAATGGEGLEYWLEVTSGINYRPGDEELAAQKWATFKVEGGRGAGTLEILARKAESATKDFEGIGGTWREENGNLITQNLGDIVAFFNDQGYAWFEENARIGKVGSVNGRTEVHWYSRDQFLTGFAPYKLEVIDPTGRRKLHSAAEKWLGHHDRRSYRRLVFVRPERAEPTDLNLWSPIPCEPVAGDVSLIVELIWNLSGGIQASFDYLLDWCAHLVQMPDDKTAVIPVLIGRQGTGKSMFAEGILGGIMGPLSIVFQQCSDIMNQFNLDQSRKFLTILDEASWGGDERLVGRLKALSGSPTMTVEEKFGGRYSMNNYSRYIITSNNANAVKVETGNRRYLIMESTGVMSPEFFDQLGPLVESGEASRRFYEYLLRRDISEFRPKTFPAHVDTQGALAKLMSMSEIGKFISTLLFDQPLAIWEKSKSGKWFVSRKALFNAYTAWASQYGKRRTYETLTLTGFSSAVCDVFGRDVWHKTRQESVIDAAPSSLRSELTALHRISGRIDHTPEDDAYLAPVFD